MLRSTPRIDSVTCNATALAYVGTLHVYTFSILVCCTINAYISGSVPDKDCPNPQFCCLLNKLKPPLLVYRLRSTPRIDSVTFNATALAYVGTLHV